MVSDGVIHRYNAALPAVYRSSIQTEADVFVQALSTLAGGDWYALDDGAKSVWEGYNLPEERALAALEKGVHKCLDLKYPLQAQDYSLLVRSLLRGCLSRLVDIGLRSKLARAAVRLMSKKECKVSGGVPWRLVVNSILDEHVECMHGAQFMGKEIRDSHCKNLVHLLGKCVFFLPEEDTAHVVWNAFVEKVRRIEKDPDVAYLSFMILSYIMPTRGVEWTGWTTEGMKLLSVVDESPHWNALWASMFARVAKHQPNTIDWSPCIPILFKHLSLSLDLPLGASAPHSPMKHNCPHHCYFLTHADLVSSAALFSIYALSPAQPAARIFLERFLVLIKNYCHPSNSGNWSSSIGRVIQYFCQTLVSRVSAERRATKAGVFTRVYSDNVVDAITPLEHRLNDEYVDALVLLLLPLIQLGLHSKSFSLSRACAFAARDLAVLSPHLVVAPLLAVANDGLTYIASPHRTSTALKLLTSLTPIFLDMELFPNGSHSLLQALELTLPGIDPNDPLKTTATMRFIAGATARFGDLLKTEAVPGMVSFLEDYIPSLLDRIFLLCAAVDVPEKRSRSMHQVPHSLLATMLENVFAALPLPLVTKAAKRIAREVVGSAKTNAIKHYGLLVRISASAVALCETESTNLSADIFLSPLLGQLLDASEGKLILATLSEEELVWRIRMVAQVSRSVGEGIEAFIPRLTSVVRLSIQKPERKVYKAGGRLLRGMLEGLTSIQASLTMKGGIWDCPNYMTWRVPSSDDWATAMDIVEEFISLAELIACGGKPDRTSRSIILSRSSLFPALRLLHAIQRGSRWLCGGAVPNEFKVLDKFKLSKHSQERMSMVKCEAMLALKCPVKAGLGGELHPERSTYLWERMYGFILKLVTRAMADRPDDSALLYRCLEPIELSGEPFKETSVGKRVHDALNLFKNSYQCVVAFKREHGAPGGVGREMPSFVFRFRILLQQEYRLAYAARPGSNARAIFEAFTPQLIEYAINCFPRVRGRARGILTRSMRMMHSTCRHQTVVQLINILSSVVQRVAVEQRREKTVTSTTARPVPDAMTEDAHDPSPIMGGGASSTVDELSTKKSDVLHHQMIGLASIVRSNASLALVIRNLPLHILVVRIMVEMLLVADRPDTIASANLLYKRVLSSYRGLPLKPPTFLNANLSASDHPDKSTYSQANSSEAEAAYINMTAYLLGLIRTPPNIDVFVDGHSSESRQAHWRLQSLVASMLYVNIRGDHPPSFEVATFFGNGLVSDIVSVRLISSKAVLLILALHGMRPQPKLESFSGAEQSSRPWSGAPNDATRALDELIGSFGYIRKVIHTLALDHEDFETGEMRKNQTWVPGGYNALVSFTSGYDSMLTWVILGGSSWPKSNIPRSRDTLSLSRVRLYEYIVKTFGKKAFVAFQGPIDELVVKTVNEAKGIIVGVRDEEARVIVGEVLSGICRGVFLSQCDRKDEIVNRITSWAIGVLNSFSGPQGAVNGGTIIRLLATADSDCIGVCVADKIFDWLLADQRLLISSDSRSSAARVQARKLRYLQCSVADESPQNDYRIKRLLNHTEELFSNSAFAHELKAVREEVGRLLAVLVSYSEHELCFSMHVDSVVARLVSSREESGINDNESATMNAEHRDESFQTGARKLRSRLGETLSNIVSLVYWGGPSKNFHPFIARLLPSLFESLDDSDITRVAQCRFALSLVAQGHFHGEQLSQIISKVEEGTKSSRWRVRCGVLPFTQVLAFMSQFLVDPKYVDSMRAIVVRLLSDEQIEVRIAAGDAIVPLIRDSPAEAVSELRRKFLTTIQTTQPARKRRHEKRTPVSPDITRIRHGGVLGLSAIVRSSPYSVPVWMPAVLVSLSNCINDPPPISTSVKSLFSDFMRTHRDEWSEHKTAFTSEELEIVSDLLVSPSYYA